MPERKAAPVREVRWATEDTKDAPAFAARSVLEARLDNVDDVVHSVAQAIGAPRGTKGGLCVGQGVVSASKDRKADRAAVVRRATAFEARRALSAFLANQDVLALEAVKGSGSWAVVA